MPADVVADMLRQLQHRLVDENNWNDAYSGAETVANARWDSGPL